MGQILTHPAIVALAAAVFDLLALGPVPDDPDGPQAAIDEAAMGKVVRCVDAAGAVVDDLSEAECHEALALIGAAEKQMRERREAVEPLIAAIKTFVHFPKNLPPA